MQNVLSANAPDKVCLHMMKKTLDKPKSLWYNKKN